VTVRVALVWKAMRKLESRTITAAGRNDGVDLRAESFISFGVRYRPERPR